jgi:hypothetical protein
MNGFYRNVIGSSNFILRLLKLRPVIIGQQSPYALTILCTRLSPP